MMVNALPFSRAVYRHTRTYRAVMKDNTVSLRWRVVSVYKQSSHTCIREDG